jgi:hypothetical protein
MTTSSPLVGVTSRFHSVLSQELVLKFDRGLPHATLFGKTAALEAHDNPIIAVSTGNIAVADIRMSESEAYGLLSTIPKEPAELSETVHRTGTEAELLSARLASYVDMEVIKAVVTIEAQPDKSHLGRGVLDTNLGTVLHDEKYIPEALFGLLSKNRVSDNAGSVNHFFERATPCTPKSAPFRSR